MATTYTNEGESLISRLLELSTTTTVTGWYIAVGSGTVTDAKTSTGCEAEATDARVTATAEFVTGAALASDTYQWEGIYTCGTATKDVSEAGLFSAATNGDLLIFGTYTGISLASDDQVSYTITLQQT